MSANAQFITTGQTSRTQITIPPESSETYNYNITWTYPDNSVSDLLTVTDIAHMYRIASPFKQDFSNWIVSSTKILAG